MKILLSIIITLLPLSILGSECQSILDEITNIQKHQFAEKDSNSESLYNLQKQHNQAMSQYAILNGISEMRTRYLSFLDEFMEIKNKKKWQKRLKRNLERGAKSTTHLIVVEKLIREISNLDGYLVPDMFYKKLKKSCLTGNNKQSALCREIDNPEIKMVVSGFYQAHLANIQNKSISKIKLELEKYKNILKSDNIPKLDSLEDQNLVLKDVLNKLDQQFKAVQKCQQKNLLDPDCNQMKQKINIDKTANEYINSMAEIIKTFEKSISKRALKLFKKRIKRASFENNYGDIDMAIDGLKEDVSQNKKIRKKILFNYNIADMRKKMVYGDKIKIKTQIDVDKEYEKINKEAFKQLDCPIAGTMLECLISLNGDDKLKSEIEKQKQLVDSLLKRVNSIRVQHDYGKMDKMKHALMARAKNKCRKTSILNCKSNISNQDDLVIFVDSVKNIIAEIDKDLAESFKNSSTKKLIEFCRDPELRKMAESTCTKMRKIELAEIKNMKLPFFDVINKKKEVEEKKKRKSKFDFDNFTYDYDVYGPIFGTAKKKTSIISNIGTQSASLLAPALMGFMNTHIMKQQLEHTTDRFQAQLQYKSDGEQAYQLWLDEGGYPYGYNPLFPYYFNSYNPSLSQTQTTISDGGFYQF